MFISCMNKLRSLISVAECFPKRSRLFSFEQLCQTKVKGKGKFLSSHQDCSKRSYILLPWQTCSFKPHLKFSEKHPAVCYKYIYIARYSFIQLSELEQCGVNKHAQGFNTAANDSNPGYLTVPLNHCAL